jgi:uncharacterized protein (DUF2252 family)
VISENGIAAIAPREHRSVGKALRDRVPRASHANLKIDSRRDPLRILHRSDADRIPELVPIRYGRMLQTPFTFFRGAASIMAADLHHTPATGTKVQACGDCHLKNFGGFATPERNIVFDISDFDETLPAPWEWDVKRLAASFIVAVRDNGLSEDVGREATLICLEEYRKEIRELASLDPLELWYTKLTAEDFLKLVPSRAAQRLAARIAKASAKRGADIDYPKLAEVVGERVRIKDNPPLIFHPQEMQAEDFEERVGAILSSYRETLADDRKVLLERYRFVDAAIKVVGIGSVGMRCWIVLLMSGGDEPLFLQFKQANASVLEEYAVKSEYPHHGQRVVMGQRLMQAASDIFLGWTTGPAGDYYVRQLRDAKIGPNIETFDADDFAAFAEACGWNLARAHAKSGNAAVIAGYLGKSDEFDQAVADFAKKYADLTERDHAALKEAVKNGKIEIFTG